MQTRIDIGQIYVSRAHSNYTVQIAKVTPNHIEGMVVSNHEKGKRQYYKRSVFERSFNLIQDNRSHAESLSIQPIKQPANQFSPGWTCSSCNKPKPIDDYRRLPSGKGGFSDKRVSICKACMSERMSTGQRKHYQKIKDKLAEPTTKPVTKPVTTNSKSTTARVLASELLELASKVENLSTPPELVTLAQAVRDLLLEGTDAAGVFVVPKPLVDKLQAAFNRIKDQIRWEQDAKD